MEHLARHYKIPVEELTSRATKPKASAAAHGRTMQASPELRALYRLGAQVEAVELAEFIRNFLRDKGVNETEIEKQLAQLKSELPRIAKNARDGLFAAEAKPRFLSKRKITSMAYETLRRNGLGEENYIPPTPIELLVDNEDGVLYRIEELKSDKRGNPLVLGLTGWDESGNRQIVINTMLADSSRESDAHRFNFTLGHEFFHALEHLPRVPREAIAPMARTQTYGALFVEGERVNYRSHAARAVDSWAEKTAGPRGLTTDEDWREWQANVFSSSLLMPEWAVRAEFQLRLEAEDVTVVQPTSLRDYALQLAGERVFQFKIHDQSLADLFAVSRQAMAIRLMELGLIKESEG